MRRSIQRAAVIAVVTTLLILVSVATGAVTSSSQADGAGSGPQQTTTQTSPQSQDATTQRRGHAYWRKVHARRVTRWRKKRLATIRARRWPRPVRTMYLGSTAYCLHGRMSDGNYTHDGAVAVLRGWGLGGWYQVRSGPFAGRILRGEDHIGSGSQFDIWVPTCGQAMAYGRQAIKVAAISPRAARLAQLAWSRGH